MVYFAIVNCRYDALLLWPQYVSYELCVERSYQSVVSQISDIRRKKALLDARSQLAKETVLCLEEFTKQIHHKQQGLAELRRYD